MHENTPPCWKNKAWLSSVWLYVLCLLTPVIFVIFGNGAVGVQFKCRFHYSYSKLFDLLANSIKRGSPGLASPKAKRRAVEKETGKVEVGELRWGSPAGRCLAAKEANEEVKSAALLRVFPQLSQFCCYFEVISLVISLRRQRPAQREKESNEQKTEALGQIFKIRTKSNKNSIFYFFLVILVMQAKRNHNTSMSPEDNIVCIWPFGSE